MLFVFNNKSSNQVSQHQPKTLTDGNKIKSKVILNGAFEHNHNTTTTTTWPPQTAFFTLLSGSHEQDLLSYQNCPRSANAGALQKGLVDVQPSPETSAPWGIMRKIKHITSIILPTHFFPEPCQLRCGKSFSGLVPYPLVSHDAVEF